MLILVADKRPSIRGALKLLIEQSVGNIIVAEAADPESVTTTLHETIPDLVLIDWELSQGKHSRLISSLKENYPHIKVLVMSGRPECREIVLNAGADAFVNKGDPPDRLMTMLKAYDLPEKFIHEPHLN